MSSVLTYFKTLLIPALISLLLFLLTTHVLIPVYHRYRTRYSRYIPVALASSLPWARRWSAPHANGIRSGARGGAWEADGEDSDGDGYDSHSDRTQPFRVRLQDAVLSLLLPSSWAANLQQRRRRHGPWRESGPWQGRDAEMYGASDTEEMDEGEGVDLPLASDLDGDLDGAQPHRPRRGRRSLRRYPGEELHADSVDFSTVPGGFDGRGGGRPFATRTNDQSSGLSRDFSTSDRRLSRELEVGFRDSSSEDDDGASRDSVLRSQALPTRS